MSQNKPTPKIGAGHAQAAFRQGLSELRNALYPESTVANRSAELGLYGTALPSEVSEQRKADPDKTAAEKDSVLNRHDYGRPPQPERDQRDMDR